MKSKMKSKIFKSLLFILICLVIGFIIGFISAKYFKESVDTNIVGDNIFVTIFRMYGVLLIIIGGYLVHMIIHELGHLFFGFMTGYSFVSFRIGSHTIIREDEKFKYKRFNIPGTAGQCLMMPPDLKDEKYPFVLYNFGGAIMNLIISIVGILVAIFVDELPSYVSFILILSGVAGVFIAVTNGIPMKIGNIANDGYNVLSMHKDEEAKRGFYLQLKVNGLQSQGVRLKDMPLNMFKLKDGADFSNPLNTSIVLMEYYWYLDNMELEMAKKCIESFTPYLDSVVPLFRYEINCERIFLELVGNCDKNIIDDLYDKNLKKYIKAAKFMIGKKRFLMAYEAFYNEDSMLALKYYEDLKLLAGKYAIKGEADMELMISGWVKSASGPVT